jgi:putative lysine transport system permease protein
MNFFEAVGKIITAYWSQLLSGIGITLSVSVIGTVIGFFIGLLVGCVRTIPKKKGKVARAWQRVYNWLLSAYVEIFRGTPMMVQAMVIYWGFAFGGVELNIFFAGCLIVSINTGAYITEIVRGGINSIDRGQTEGAAAVGMSHWQTMSKVIIPQTVKNILPAVSNEFVVNVKDTSVLSVIPGFFDLYGVMISIGVTFVSHQFVAYLIVCAIYFLLTFSITRVLRLIERKLLGHAHYQLVNTDLITPVADPKEAV